MSFGIPDGLDERIGNIVAWQVKMIRNEKGEITEKQKLPIKLKDCNESTSVQLDNNSNQNYSVSKNSKLKCYDG